MAKKTSQAKNEQALNQQLNNAIPAKLPEGYRVRKSVTMPTLVIKNSGDARVISINTPFEKSKVVTKSADGKTQEPATICNVTDQGSGEILTFLVPKVVEKNLEDQYPNTGYVGKVFFIECKGKRTEGQRYKDFGISEVEKT